MEVKTTEINEREASAGTEKEEYEAPKIQVFIWDMKRISERRGMWGPPWHNWANNSSGR